MRCSVCCRQCGGASSPHDSLASSTLSHRSCAACDGAVRVAVRVTVRVVVRVARHVAVRVARRVAVRVAVRVTISVMAPPS